MVIDRFKALVPGSSITNRALLFPDAGDAT